MRKNYFLSFLLILVSYVSSAQITELYISKYGEGSSNNKFLEIYNGTSGAINLNDYAFATVGNAPTTPGEYEFWNKFPDGATIAAGDVFVIAHPSANATILAASDMTFQFLSNGDDGLALVKGGTHNDANMDGDIDAGEMTGFTILDWLGDWDGDPGSGWDVAGVAAATANHTLTRKTSVCGPNNDWAASAGTDAASSEWIVTDIDTEFDKIGSYSGCITTPTLTISSPTDGSTISFTDMATVKFSVSNFNVASGGSGDGYIKYTVNSGAAIDKFDTTDITFSSAAGTTYTVYMELVDNSGNPLSTAVNDTVTFTVNFPCDIQLGTITTTCNAETAALDTYDVSIAFTGGGTSTYTLTADNGTVGGDNPSMMASGTITISGVTEGTNIVLTVKGDMANSSCDFTRNISSPTCKGLPFIDTFDYSDAAVLSAQANWETVNSGDDIVVATGSLDYTGLKASEGNKITFSESGAESYTQFTDVSSGTVYSSFLLKVAAFQTGSSPDTTDGGYIAGLAAGTSSYDARLWVRPNPDTSGTTFDIGFGAESSNPPFTTSTYNVGDVLFIVMAYDLDNDVVSLWINPDASTFEGAAPTPDLGGNDPSAPSNINTFILRQDSSNETPSIEIDELRIAKTWAEVTPKEATASVDKNDIEGFAVYPNPVNAKTFKLTTASFTTKTVQIFNVLGKEVYNTRVNGANNDIDVATLNSGIYILKVVEGEKVASKKLIIR
ncbi:T9SS type A sorting domain-containing protein [Tenacibaculum sp. 190524A05c]|uniref:T9SS type A sorting domain-containing protein n=1 Tax=Tenacibaculum platacis TaxID=3137852 RepID=UPI0032B2F51A